MKDLVNRDTETKCIDDVISRRNINENLIMFIAGKEGVGKTEFIEYCAQTNSKGHIIKVDASKKNDQINEGYFILLLAKQLDECANSRSFQTFNQFVTNENYNDFSKKALSNLVKNKGANVFWDIVLAIINTHATPLEITEAFNNGALNGLICEAIKYVSYVLNTENNLTICIENFNAIDLTSLEKLEEIIVDTYSHIFFLEFRLEKELSEVNSFISKHLYAHKSGKYQYLLLPLDKLALVHFKEVCQQEMKYIAISDINLTEDVYNSLYKESNGNLHKISNIITSSQFVNSKIDISPLLDLNLSELFSEQKELLALVVVFEQPLDIGILKSSLTQTESLLLFNCDDVIDSLAPKYIKKIGNYIEVSGLDVQEIFYKDPTCSLYELLAFNHWEKYYEESIHQKNNRTYFIALIKLLARYDTNKLLEYKNELKNYLFTSFVTPQSAAEFLKSLQYNMTDIERKELKLLLLDIYYKMDCFSEAYDVLNSLKPYSELFLFAYEAMLLNRLRKNDDAINFINNYLKIKNDRLFFIFKCILVLCYAGKNDYKSANNIYIELEDQKERYMNLPEYGFMLRNYNIVRSPRNSLSYIKASITFFEGDDEKQGISYITYGMNLSRIGKYFWANKFFEKALKRLDGKIFQKHIILNNMAVNIFRSNGSLEVAINMLKDSIITAISKYDKTVIYNNLLAIMSVVNPESKLCLKAIEQITQLGITFHDHSLLSKAYKNIALFYKKKGNKRLFTEFMNKALYERELLTCTSETNWREFEIKDTYNDSDISTTYISFWHFDINRF